MRRGAAPLAALLLLAACGPAGAPLASPSPSPAAAVTAALAVDPDGFDFGRVLPQRPLQKSFTLRNLGREPLTIAAVTTDCGCVVVGGYEKVLPAGAASTLTLVLNTPPQAGRVERTIVVRTAPPREESVGFKLRADVVAAESDPR